MDASVGSARKPGMSPPRPVRTKKARDVQRRYTRKLHAGLEPATSRLEVSRATIAPAERLVNPLASGIEVYIRLLWGLS